MPTQGWSPCPNEARGRACSKPGIGLEQVPLDECIACRETTLVPTTAMVIKLGSRTIHWTCRCGQHNHTPYSKNFEREHYLCLLVRNGADVVRVDNVARLDALRLEEMVIRS